MAVHIQDSASTNQLKVNSDGSIQVNVEGTPALPSGAATSANQTNASQKTQIVDGSGNVIASTSNALNVDVINSSIAVTASSLPLPTGASTSALQTSGNATLTAISGQLPATLGAKTTANSVAVNIASDQTVPVSGTLTATVTGVSTAANQTNGTQQTKITDGTNIVAVKPASTAAVATDPAQVVAISPNNSVAVTGTFWQATQPVSAASLPLPTGAATSALQTAGNTTLTTINTTLGSPFQAGGSIGNTTFAVTQATAANLNANITNISGTVSLPTGASTSALQTTGNTSLASIVTNQTNGTQTTGLVAGSANIGSITNVTGTVSLPTGASTSALQTTGNTSLATIATNTTPLTQGSTTTGQSGELMMGAVTTAAPAYTTAQTSPLSLKPTGDLRVDSVIADGFLSTIATNTGAQALDFTQTGTITALNGTVSITGQGVYTVTASITGTWAATLVFEGQTADNNWIILPVSVQASTLPFANAASTTTNGVYIITGGGYLNIRVRASAFTSGTVAVALDGSLSQQTIYAGQLGAWAMTATGNVASGSADSGNGVKVSGVYNTTVPALTAGQRGDIQVDARGAQQITPLDGSRQTYSMSGQATLAATATDVATIYGSASKTIRITSVRISGIATTALTTPVFLIKRSATNTGGTSTSMTAVPHDSTNAAATATGLIYTVNPTGLGAAVGTVRQTRYSFQLTASTAETPIVWEATRPAQAIVLRGTAQGLAINLNSTTVTGGVINVDLEWTEE